MGKAKTAATFTSEALNALALEFPSSDKEATETLIQNRIRRKKLGPYDPKRVALLRQLKDVVQDEIGRGENSQYFLGRYDPAYVDLKDFDVPRFLQDMARRFPVVPKRDLRWFVPYCVFLYYLK